MDNQTYKTHNNFMSRQDLFTVMSNDQIILKHFDSKNPALSLVRNEELDGRSFIVVPCVMLTEGVHKGSNGPIYYSQDEISRAVDQWNLKPIIVDHPYNGKSGGELETYKRQCVGHIMHPSCENGKLKAEAWLDIEKVREKCPQILTHIEHGLPMEVSTGLLNEIICENGTWHGEPFIGKIAYIRADHLAILPKEQGACSISDGAGLLCNAQNDESLIASPATYNAFYVTGDSLRGTEYPAEPLKGETVKKSNPIPTTPLPQYHMPEMKSQEQFLQGSSQQIDPTLIATIAAAVSASVQPALQQMAQMVQSVQEASAQTPPAVQASAQPAQGQNPEVGPYQQTDPTGASVPQIAPEPPNQEPAYDDRPGLATAQGDLNPLQAEAMKKGIDQLYNPPQVQEPEEKETSEMMPPPKHSQNNMRTTTNLNELPPVQDPSQVPQAPVDPMSADPAAGVPADTAPVDPNAEQLVDPMRQVISLLQQAITALQTQADPNALADPNAFDPNAVPADSNAPAESIQETSPIELARKVDNVQFKIINSKRNRNKNYVKNIKESKTANAKQPLSPYLKVIKKAHK
jgi:hypothetical protein